MKIWDIWFKRRNYMDYLEYGPVTATKGKKIEVRQLGLKKVVIVRIIK